MLLGNAGSFASKQKSLISDMRPNTDTSTVNSLTHNLKIQKLDGPKCSHICFVCTIEFLRGWSHGILRVPKQEVCHRTIPSQVIRTSEKHPSDFDTCSLGKVREEFLIFGFC